MRVHLHIAVSPETKKLMGKMVQELGLTKGKRWPGYGRLVELAVQNYHECRIELSDDTKKILAQRVQETGLSSTKLIETLLLANHIDTRR